MIIGVPKEIKDHETRVGLVPSGVIALCEAGHEVLVETHAGEGSSLPDSDYEQAGAKILASAGEVWQDADLVVKVKEPQKAEYGFFRPGLTLFTYLHLAPLPELTEKLLAAKVNGVAYETIREKDGSLPLLTPMSEVAGRMSVQVGAQYLERPSGGRGILLGGVPGVAPGNVVILGGGIVGTNAAKMAIGMGAHVTIIDRSLNRLRELDDIFNGYVVTLASNAWTISENGICVDAYAPGTSRIRGVARHARDSGVEVILNANTREGSLDQYTSMVLEKTLADPVADRPELPQHFSSSELVPHVLAPGLAPTYTHGAITHGDVVVRTAAAA